MMNEPYIKLYKKLEDWRWYKHINHVKLFIHCLLKANWKDGYFESEFIPRGSFATSIRKLARETGLSEQNVRTVLKDLSNTELTQFSTHELTHVSKPKFTIITVKNYDSYQPPNTEVNTGSAENLTTIEEEISSISSYINNNYARKLSEIEIDKIKLWLKYYDEKTIKLAIQISCENDVKTIQYTNGILRTWYQRGYKTYEECFKHSNPNYENKEEEKEPVKELFDYNWLEDDD